MPFERGRPPIPRPAPKTSSSPVAKPVPKPAGPGDTTIRESLSRTSISLKAIREELADFENEITWRDQRLAEFEQELRDARTALERERAKAVPSQVDGAALERLRDAEQQLERHTEDMKERDARIQALTQKGRELLGRVQALTQERTRSSQALAEMVKQIQEQQRRAQGLEVKLQEYQQRGDGAGLDGPGIMAPSRWRSLSRGARIGIVTGVICVVVGSFALATSTLLRIEPRYSVAGQLIVPFDQMERAARLVRSEPGGQEIQTTARELDAQAAALTLAIETVRPKEAADRLNGLGSVLVTKLTPPPMVVRDTSSQKLALEARLADLDRQLGSQTTQPGESFASQQGGLLKSWREQLSERQEVEDHLRALRPTLSSPPPDQTRFTVPVEQLTAAQGGDAKLQADVQALSAKEQDLRVLLRKSIDSGDVVFNRLAAAITSGTKDVSESAQDNSETEVTQSVETITKAMAGWTQNLSELRETWQTATRPAQEDAFDPIAISGRLEPAVRAFAERTKSGRETIQKALDTIGEGGEEPTKRIVLRNTLSKQLEGVLSAQEGAVKTVKSLLASDNAELAGLTQTITGLRVQVRDQKERIAAELKADALRRVQLAYDQDMAKARTEQERWLKRAAELDEALLEHNRKVLSLLPQLDGERTAASRRADLYRERSQVLAQLADLSHQQAELLASKKPSIDPRYVPAHETPIPVSPRQRLAQALLLGSLPMFIGLLALAAVWAGVLWARSRQLTSKYEELLTRHTP